MGREVVIVALQGGDTRPPTVADIIEWLRAHPEQALEVLDHAKVARPWARGASESHRFGAAFVEKEAPRRHDESPRPWWHAGLTYRTREEAEAAADASLREAGWVLVEVTP